VSVDTRSEVAGTVAVVGSRVGSRPPEVGSVTVGSVVGAVVVVGRRVGKVGSMPC
jgi:hypothetical protein